MASRPGPRGSLFAIGGREARRGQTAVLERFVECAGGAAARLVVLSTASTEPERLMAEYAEAFRNLGVSEVSYFHQETCAEASHPEVLGGARPRRRRLLHGR